MAKQAGSRGYAAAAAREFRERVTGFLNDAAPGWLQMSDEALSKVLVSAGVPTATGKRFSPERVREFRRAREKAAAQDFFWSATDHDGTAESVRRGLFEAIEELREPVSKERHAELERLVTRCGLILCEDRFAGHALLRKAVEVAERSLARRRP